MEALPRLICRLPDKRTGAAITLTFWGPERGYAITVNEVGTVVDASISVSRNWVDGAGNWAHWPPKFQTLCSIDENVPACNKKILEFETEVPGYLESFDIAWDNFKDYVAGRSLKLTHTTGRYPDGTDISARIVFLVRNAEEQAKARATPRFRNSDELASPGKFG